MYVADLHVHSRYAYASSRRLDLGELSRWARLKGIDLLSAGDLTHPGWMDEISAGLTDAGDGLYEHGGVRFVLGGEVCSVSRQGGRSRRVHVLLFVPSIASARSLGRELARFGRMDADGRPTVRLSPRDLVHLAHGVDPECLVVAAHVWTPWYGALGARSGFDSLAECFGDGAALVAAAETGLSSDPAMNWEVPSLDDFTLVSFSDAHSGPRLGREATVLEGEPGYAALARGLRTGAVASTIEMHPAQGKYHHGGHRACGYRAEPGGRPGRACPVCGGGATRGVADRVAELSRRRVRTWTDGDGLVRGDAGRPPFRRLVALSDIVSEAVGRGPSSRAVREPYMRLATELGGELRALVDAPLGDVAALSTDLIAEGVGRARSGRLIVEPGYDGLYGTVRIWPDDGA